MAVQVTTCRGRGHIVAGARQKCVTYSGLLLRNTDDDITVTDIILYRFHEMGLVSSVPPTAIVVCVL